LFEVDLRLGFVKQSIVVSSNAWRLTEVMIQTNQPTSNINHRLAATTQTHSKSLNSAANAE